MSSDQVFLYSKCTLTVNILSHPQMDGMFFPLDGFVTGLISKDGFGQGAVLPRVGSISLNGHCTHQDRISTRPGTVVRDRTGPSQMLVDVV